MTEDADKLMAQNAQVLAEMQELARLLGADLDGVEERFLQRLQQEGSGR